MSERISFVIPQRMRKELRDLQRLSGEDQSTVLRRLLEKGLSETKIEIAIDSYVKGKTSLERSSRIAGLSLWDFLDELRARNVALRYSLADAEFEIKTILGVDTKGE